MSTVDLQKALNFAFIWPFKPFNFLKLFLDLFFRLWLERRLRELAEEHKRLRQLERERERAAQPKPWRPKLPKNKRPNYCGMPTAKVELMAQNFCWTICRLHVTTDPGILLDRGWRSSELISLCNYTFSSLIYWHCKGNFMITIQNYNHHYLHQCTCGLLIFFTVVFLALHVSSKQPYNYHYYIQVPKQRIWKRKGKLLCGLKIQTQCVLSVSSAEHF